MTNPATTDARVRLPVIAGMLWSLVRWQLVPVASCAGFYAALIPGVWLYGYLREMCPWGDAALVAAIRRGESVDCPIPSWVDALMYGTFASLAAVAVVALGSVVAPVRRPWIPWGIYLAGAAVDIRMAVALSGIATDRLVGAVLVPASSALVTGAVVAALFARWMGRRD
jgi:hypothetical protein